MKFPFKRGDVYIWKNGTGLIELERGLTGIGMAEVVDTYTLRWPALWSDKWHEQTFMWRRVSR